MSQGPRGEPLGLWLRQQREAAGLTQEELAERTGLSARTIGNLERARMGKPYPSTVRLVTSALGLTETAPDETVTRNRAAHGLHGQALAGGDDGARPGLEPAESPEQGPFTIQRPVPHQLPAVAAYFTGRAAELDVLAGLAARCAGGVGQTAVISAIGGTAGVGKTALAVHFGHQAAGLFPDGQLYVNLAGFGPSGSPLSPGQAVRGFLDALGIAPEQIPADLDGQAGLYRSLLAGRRMLVALDNAADEQQVRPLLPGSPGCLAVVTSRGSCRPGGRGGSCADQPGLLPAGEALQLLAARLGGARVAAEPDAAGELVAFCGGLPLALAIAAARGAVRPGFSLAELAAELQRGRHALMPWTLGLPAPASGQCSPGRTRPSASPRRGCSGCWACTPARTSALRRRPAWPTSATRPPGCCWTS